jgi:hypothetical protein
MLENRPRSTVCYSNFELRTLNFELRYDQGHHVGRSSLRLFRLS